MTKNILLSLFLLLCAPLLGQQRLDTIAQQDWSTLNDGPYIFIERNQLVEKRIVNGKVERKSLAVDAYRTTFKAEESRYGAVEKIAALSDIHGQYDLAVEILINNKIIDGNLNWIYGTGHFVVVGDIFDRGPKVNETLWLIYKLEQQAEAAGGKVHFVLGNHEYMILHSDLRYLNKKYEAVTDLLGLGYAALYGPDTVLGRWLRSKNTILKIGTNLFVHGGISKEFIGDRFELQNTNKLMRKSIERTKVAMKSTDFYTRYYGKTGPIWYRGYFEANLAVTEIDEILEKVNSKHLVVGHCSNEEVVQLYNNRIFGVDSSIKLGQYGEILFIEGSKYYRGTLEGEKIEFVKKSD